MSEQEFNSKIIELKPAMEKWALSRTQDLFRADDLVQDTYEKVIRFKHLFNGGDIKSWVFIIMRNSFINTYRSDKITLQGKVEVSIQDISIYAKSDHITPQTI